MPRLSVLAMMALACATTLAHATEASATCTGQLTVARLSDPACASRIPLPEPRPATARQASGADATGAPSPAYVMAHDVDGSPRRIRVVGNRFLPPLEERIDFEGRQKAQASLVMRAAMAGTGLLRRLAGTGSAPSETAAGGGEIVASMARADLR